MASNLQNPLHPSPNIIHLNGDKSLNNDQQNPFPKNMHHNGCIQPSKSKSKSQSIPSILHPEPPPSPSPSKNNNRKRPRDPNELLSSSPNINNTLKRQRRKLSSNLPSLSPIKTQIKSILHPESPPPPPSAPSPSPSKLKKKRLKSPKNTKRINKKKINNKDIDNWSESGDDEYIPPKKRKTPSAKNQNTPNTNSTRPRRSSRRLNQTSSCSSGSGSGSGSSSSSCSSASDNNEPSGYRSLNWRKKEVATPSFKKLDNIFSNSNTATATATATGSVVSINKLYRAKSDISGISNKNKNELIEDTSNEAYFYRHYRAEQREKLFYDELFESRIKQQKILEEKERRNNYNNNRKRKRNSLNNLNNDDDNDNKLNDDDNIINESDIDLKLPSVPKGPWTYKLGPEFDKKPNVPGLVTSIPQFNYVIPKLEILRKRQQNENEDIVMELSSAKKCVLPNYLIKRIDYGNIKQKTNINLSLQEQNRNELILLYNQLNTQVKQKQKQQLKILENKIIKKKNKKKDKKLNKKKIKNKNKHKNKNKSKNKNKNKKDFLIKRSSGPVDVRELLAQKKKK